MSLPYIVTGPRDGKNYPRLEIQMLMKEPYQWSLFLQALRNLKTKGYKPEPASWQEVAGIHGLPYTRWSGDPAGPAQPDDKQIPDPDGGSPQTQWQGYCYHASILFPTWHRVLMSLVEQAVSDEAKVIVTKITQDHSVDPDERSKWVDAADRLRFPYWDWSARKAETDGLPKVLSTSEVEVLGPKQTKILLNPNPLEYYEFNEIPQGTFDDASLGIYFKEWKRTYRWATPKGSVNPKDGSGEFDDDYAKLDKALIQGLGPSENPFGRALPNISAMCDKLRRIFSFPATADHKKYATYWDYFSNTAPQSCKTPKDPTKEPAYMATYSSLEAPHNTMHLDIGGSGDMAFNEMAGFDPIFYLHHCNVDRLYALWEYVYPDYWMGQGYYDQDTGKGPIPFEDPQGTYQEDPNAPIGEKTQLAPFRKTPENYWISTDIHGLIPSAHKPQTYSYPPLVLSTKAGQVKIDVTQPADLATRKKYIAALQEYYKDLSPQDGAPVAKPPMFHADSLDKREVPATHKPVHGIRDFVVVGHVPQFAFKGSHKLELHLDDKFVNDISVFSRLDPERCENCARRMAAGNANVRGALGLPHAYVVQVLEKENKNLEGTTDDEVVDALKKHLSARIVKPDGSPLAAHVPASVAAASQELQDKGISEENRPTLHLCSARILEGHDPSTPLERADWRHHGAVLNEHWHHVRS